MTANPNQHWGAKNDTSVSRFLTRIVEDLEKRLSCFGSDYKMVEHFTRWKSANY